MSSPHKTRVQVATDPAFSNIIHDVNGDYATALQIAEDILPGGVNLYARGMHGHPTTGDSSWSTIVQFMIKRVWLDWSIDDAGIAFTYSNNSTTHPSLVKLDDNRALVIFGDATTGDTKVTVLTISGTVVSRGTIYTINNQEASWNSATLVSSNKVLVVYKNIDTGYGVCRCLSISNTVVSIGSPHTFFDLGNIAYHSFCVARMSDNKAIVAFNTNYESVDFWRSHVKILTVSGTTVTSSGLLKLDNESTRYPYILPLGDGVRALVSMCAAAGTSPDNSRFVVISMSGSILTKGSVYVSSFGYVRPSVLLKSNRIISIASNGNSEILNISNLSISSHTIHVNLGTGSRNMSICEISQNMIAVNYTENTTALGKVVVIKIKDDDSAVEVGRFIDYNDRFTSQDGGYIKELMIPLSGNRLLVVYGDTSDYIGKARIIVG